jgi:DNA-binding NtrC family response regulator
MMIMKNILIVTRDPETHKTILGSLDQNNHAQLAESKEAAIEIFSSNQIEFLFIEIDFILPTNKEDSIKSQLQPFWRISPDCEIIILTPDVHLREAVQAVKAGASNYLTLPIDPTEFKYIMDSIRKEVRVFAELKYLRNRFWNRDSLQILQTKNKGMKEVFEKIRAVAQTDTTVLLTGETGTGKGIMANLIRRHSMRSEKQFMPVHCGAIPDSLLESELFGHEKGAFTGAIHKKLGKFEIAHGGTLFLDEIGTISSSMQVKLLQVLQDRFFHRVGGEKQISVDVRVIVATNSDLKTMCADGTFRQDLYYRLNVFPIELPPLRDRKEDVPYLVETILKRLNKFSLKNIIDIDSKVMEAFQKYHWPGNIRELENLIERAYVLEKKTILTPLNFPQELFEHPTHNDLYDVGTNLCLKDLRKQTVDRLERRYLELLLEETQGRINRTAERAGISMRQLHKLLTKYGIRKEQYKKNL